MEDTKFVFVIPVYNCEHTIHRTLKSIAAQSYENWRILIREDMSTDDTATALNDWDFHDLFAHMEEGKFKITYNEEKHGEVRNTLEACKEIDDDEVVVRLDGGDWLTDTDALHMLHTVYSQHDPAVCWTQHRWAYQYGRNISGPLPPDCDVYKYPWVTSHLKTFRKSAINGINHKNFLDDDGNYIMIACDQAVFLPILHKAYLDGKPRIHIPKVCYHYNIDLQKPDLFTCERSKNQKVSAETIRLRGYIA
jgi:glycosyltransferase involved in cell wall biosynthesis